MARILLFAVLLCGPVLASTDTITEVVGDAAPPVDSSSLILVRSKFWGTYQRKGVRLRYRDFRRLYAESGDTTLIRSLRRSMIVEYGGYLGCLAVGSFLIPMPGVHNGVAFTVMIGSVVPLAIGNQLFGSTIRRYNEQVARRKPPSP